MKCRTEAFLIAAMILTGCAAADPAETLPGPVPETALPTETAETEPA